MRKFYFYARDLRDYLRGVMNTTELDNTRDFEPNFPALTDAPAIQDFLFDVMKIYEYREEGCSSPITGETARELECQKKISQRQVINAIERLIIDKNLTPPILRT